MSTIPSLPQHDNGAQQQERKKELAQAQQQYVYDHDSRIAPLPTVVSVPKEANFRPVWVVGVIAAVTPLLANVLAEGSRLFANGKATESGAEHGMTDAEVRGAEGAFAALVAHHKALSAHHAELSSPPSPQAPAPEEAASEHHGLRGLVDRVEDVVEGVVQKVLHPLKTVESMVEAALRELEELIKTVLSEAFRLLLRYLGLYGVASSMQAFDDLFRLLALPPLSAGWDDDMQLARLRVAGPNPLMIQRLTAPDARFPVTDAMWKAVFGDDDSFDAAIAEGRAYLTDYKDLDGAPNGSTPVQKFSAAPLALFGVPPVGAPDRALRAVAIQCGQTPGHSTPIFTPRDGGAWRVAKLCVQVADGNMHELVAHLGHTHLVLQPFAIATPRTLPPQHPLNVLLSPHLLGTLPINQAAVSTLIAPGGAVDTLPPAQVDTTR
jgi:arachidonate 15-lipoxygenase